MSKLYKNMSYARALEKAMRYCSYQERCLMDMEKRFYAWNVKKTDWDKIIDYLIDENYLNETRFIEAYVRGKFVIKRWGKNKIIAGLMQLNLSGSKVTKAIDSEIEEKAYVKTIQELITKKSALINESDSLIKRDKIYRYLLSKGYESELVVRELNALAKEIS
ncbi:MAG: RecX family transcriptional regulator [Vicingus serpentipes]|nr:RecX family transcriptional regulator [Vicingus serpentipes]